MLKSLKLSLGTLQDSAIYTQPFRSRQTHQARIIRLGGFISLQISL